MDAFRDRLVLVDGAEALSAVTASFGATLEADEVERTEGGMFSSGTLGGSGRGFLSRFELLLVLFEAMLPASGSS